MEEVGLNALYPKNQKYYYLFWYFSKYALKSPRRTTLLILFEGFPRGLKDSSY